MPQVEARREPQPRRPHGQVPAKARAFHGTYTQAQKALAEFVAEINGGEVVRRSAWTFKDYADHFCMR